MRHAKRREKGSGLIIVILIVGFLVAIGVPLLTITGIGSKVSATLRTHEEAFNAAEAGFDAARIAVEFQFATGGWGNFQDHYLVQPNNIDRPILPSGSVNPDYFRRKTDQELLAIFDANNDGIADVPNVLFLKRRFATTAAGTLDTRYAFTVFLIDENVGKGVANPDAALLVAIGTVMSGSRIVDSVRLEVQIAIEI